MTLPSSLAFFHNHPAFGLAALDPGDLVTFPIADLPHGFQVANQRPLTIPPCDVAELVCCAPPSALRVAGIRFPHPDAQKFACATSITSLRIGNVDLIRDPIPTDFFDTTDLDADIPGLNVRPGTIICIAFENETSRPAVLPARGCQIVYVLGCPASLGD